MAATPPGRAAQPGPATPLDPSGELRALAGDCVHCGFCLPACPTYQLWGEEMDSPRGRIHLITQILDGTGAGTRDAAAVHLDRCLGCMACVPACPSGVRYDKLIEAARTWSEEPPSVGPEPATDPEPADETTGPGAPAPATAPGPGPARPLPPRSLRDRAVRAAIFGTFPYPQRLRFLIAGLRAAQRAGLDRALLRGGILDRVSPELASALRVAPRPSPARGMHGARTPRAPRAPRAPCLVAARGTRRATVGLLTGCVQRAFFPQVNAATVRVLAAEGCDVVIPSGQGCCGALSMHGGRREEAAAFARRTIEAFERAGVDAVIVNAAGCGSAMKDYADLLAGDPAWAGRAAGLATRVRDFSEFLAALGPAAPRHPLPVTVAYHDACHLANAQGVTAQPRDLLRAVPGLRLTEIADGGTCCGSAGIYNLVQPEAAGELGRRKATAVAATGAGLLVSANPGCALQIAAALAASGTRMSMAHIAEVLDASIRAEPPSALG